MPTAQRWAVPLSGDWVAGDGAQGTEPASGQAYAAVGDGVAVVGSGLMLTGYRASDGRQLWQATLPGTVGASIASVRAWSGVVTAGVVTPGGNRTEDVIDASTGVVLRGYPAAVFGGAVAASAGSTVVIGAQAVTSYDNRTGRVRWRRSIGARQPWRSNGAALYLADSAGGYLASAPVTAVTIISLQSGGERTLRSPPGHPFAGTLAIAADGVLLFAADSGVTAYSQSTGDPLWSQGGAVPEGTDPAAGLIDLTLPNGTLVAVDPVAGVIIGSASAAAIGSSDSLYVSREGVALALAGGAAGGAWGYALAGGTVRWAAPDLPWPHYFADVSGIGGSADSSGDMAVITACPRLAAAGRCPDPELVALQV